MLDDQQAVTDAVRANTSLDEDQRDAALRAVREPADRWWPAREDGLEDC